jgi:radical SAM protein (TIGR01212 family)
MEQNYNYVNEYYKNKFGERVLKICVDGGFTCPNRDGTCGVGGCIFCSERGSGDLISKKQSIREQVLDGLKYKDDQTHKAEKFIVYFQNFTNTYDTVDNLKKKYDEALCDERIVGLDIATRPDCMDEEKVKLIKTYADKYYVSVELGLQTANDNTAKLINRGYDKNVFAEAVKLLRKYNIDVIVHIMLGLPNETFDDVKETVNFINQFDIQGIKIHSTYIVKNTKLNEMFLNKKFTPISFEDYMEQLIYVITNISEKLVIYRYTGDPPKENFVSPEWQLHKKKVMNTLNNTMKNQKLKQGMYYQNNQ